MARRPPIAKYQDWIEGDGLLRLQDWARRGLQLKQIAHNIGIDPHTLTEWMKKYPSVSAALKRGQDIVDIEVENDLRKSASGFFVEEVTEERVWDKTTESYVFEVTKRQKKFIPPQVVAQIFWLKNRRPEEWRDKRQVAASVTDRNTSRDFINALNGKAATVFENPDEPMDMEDGNDE